jgi:hypothetical protein
MKKYFESKQYPENSFIEIVDETEDFDFPEDFDKWNRYVKNKEKIQVNKIQQKSIKIQ